MKKSVAIILGMVMTLSLLSACGSAGNNDGKTDDYGEPSPTVDTVIEVTQTGNPFLPMWELIPDGEARVYMDAESGEERVYLYGSHDTSENHAWCGTDYVVWSAATSDLTDWKWEGISFDVSQLEGMAYKDEAGNDATLSVDPLYTLYAPDCVYDSVIGKYVLFGFVAGAEPANVMFTATSDSPAGPFENPQFLGYGFDPAVLVDGETMYLYYTVESEHRLYVCELDMEGLTIKEDTTTALMGIDDPEFELVEGQSIRRIGDVYVLSYTKTIDGGIQNLSELAYATASSPYGDFTYGGVIIANDGRYEYGSEENTFYGGNIHGGMFEVDGQWYQIYHRSTNNNLKRQAMATPINVVEENGTVTIAQADLDSTGFLVDGLDPYQGFYAASLCYETPLKAVKVITNEALDFDPESEREDYYPVTEINAGDEIGYSFFDFGDNTDALKLQISLKELAPCCIEIYAADYSEESIGSEPEKELVGTMVLSGTGDGEHVLETEISAVSGKKSIYLKFVSDSAENLCELNKLVFVK